jgi:hypothetical protein
MHRAMDVIHLVTDVFHDVDLTGIRPGITIIAALPVFVVSAGSRVGKGAAGQHPDCRPRALPFWQPGPYFDTAVKKIGFPHRLQPARGISSTVVILTMGFDDQVAVFDTHVLGTCRVGLVLVVYDTGSPHFDVPVVCVRCAILVKFVAPHQLARLISGGTLTHGKCAKDWLTFVGLEADIQCAIFDDDAGHGNRQRGLDFPVSP